MMLLLVLTSAASRLMFSSYMEITNFSTQRYVWILPFTCYRLHVHAPLPALRARYAPGLHVYVYMQLFFLSIMRMVLRVLHF